MKGTYFSDNAKYEICKVRYTASSFEWFLAGLILASSDAEKISGKVKVSGKAAGRLTNLLNDWKVENTLKDGKVYIDKIPEGIMKRVGSFMAGDLPDIIY